MYTAKEHTDMINSIDGIGGNSKNCGAPEIVTGSRDGNLLKEFLILLYHILRYLIWL